MKKVGNFHQLWDHSEEHMIIPNELLYFLGINRARRMFFLVVYFTSENGIAERRLGQRVISMRSKLFHSKNSLTALLLDLNKNK